MHGYAASDVTPKGSNSYSPRTGGRDAVCIGVNGPGGLDDSACVLCLAAGSERADDGQ